MCWLFFVDTGLGNLIQDRGSEETELVIDFYDHDSGDGGVGAGDAGDDDDDDDDGGGGGDDDDDDGDEGGGMIMMVMMVVMMTAGFLEKR